MSEDQNLAVQTSVTGFFQELGGELLEYQPRRAAGEGVFKKGALRRDLP